MRTASDIATCMYHTGLGPFTGEEVYVAKHLRDRMLRRALLQFFKPENYLEVRQALMAAGRSDLIGSGCDCLIPAQPPKAALQARIGKAARELTEGHYVHAVDEEQALRAQDPKRRLPSNAGYRPHRQSSRRRPR
jgi:hypothetical protein